MCGARHVVVQLNGISPSGDSEFTFWRHLATDLETWRGDCVNAGFGGSRTEDLVRCDRP